MTLDRLVQLMSHRGHPCFEFFDSSCQSLVRLVESPSDSDQVSFSNVLIKLPPTSRTLVEFGNFQSYGLKISDGRGKFSYQRGCNGNQTDDHGLIQCGKNCIPSFRKKFRESVGVFHRRDQVGAMRVNAFRLRHNFFERRKCLRSDSKCGVKSRFPALNFLSSHLPGNACSTGSNCNKCCHGLRPSCRPLAVEPASQFRSPRVSLRHDPKKQGHLDDDHGGESDQKSIGILLRNHACSLNEARRIQR